MKIQDLKNKIEKATIGVATVNKENKPHSIAIIYAKVQDQKIIITNNFMKTTVENLKNNPHISLVFWEGETGFSIDGKEKYPQEGKWFKYVKELKENKRFNPKGAIVIKVKNIKEL